MTDEVADALEELAEYLELDGQRGLSSAYSRAANSVREAGYIPPDPARLDGVGDSIRDDIVELQQTGSISMLDTLKRVHPYYENFRDIDGVGPVLSRNLGQNGIETRDDLREAIESGDILNVPGVGQKTADNILRNL